MLSASCAPHKTIRNTTRQTCFPPVSSYFYITIYFTLYRIEFKIAVPLLRTARTLNMHGMHGVGLNKTRSRTMTFLSSTLALSPHLEFSPAGFFLLSRSSVFDQAYCFVCCFQSHGHINFRLQLLRSCNSQRPTANI